MSNPVTCIIQARMGSTRLPGKVLMEICGKPMLEHLIDRVRQSVLIKKLVIATTETSADSAIAQLGEKLGVFVFRGKEDDVLDRYYNCAKALKAGIIVRVTGDCPLMDPLVIDAVVNHFLKGMFDYASNAYPKATYPDGMDVEVFSFTALEKAWKEAPLKSEREHVTPYIWKNEKGIFRLGTVRSSTDLSSKRWTVDNPGDLEFIRSVYNRLYPIGPLFGMEKVLELLKREPELEILNSGTMRNEGYKKSLRNDRIVNNNRQVSGG